MKVKLKRRYHTKQKSFNIFLKFKKNSGRQDGKPFRKSSKLSKEFQKDDGKKKNNGFI